MRVDLLKELAILTMVVILSLAMAGCGTEPELVKVTIDSTEGGYVEEKIDGEWVTENVEDERSVESETSIQLRAVAEEDYDFIEWTIDDAEYGDLEEEEIVVTNFADDATIKAHFEEIIIETYTITFKEENGLAGVEISVDGQDLITDADGEASIDLEDGTYDFTAEKEGYVDHSASFTVDGAAKTVEFELVKMIAKIVVTDADELHDALVDQHQYDVIVFAADIEENVDYEIRLVRDNLIFDVKEYSLEMDAGYDFQVKGNNVTIRGNQGKITVPSGRFEADTGGDLMFTVDGVEFNIDDGSFLIKANYEAVVSHIDITNSIINIPTGNFEYDICSDYTAGTLNIMNSEFHIGPAFYAHSSTFRGVYLTVNIMESKFFIDAGPFPTDCIIRASGQGSKAEIKIVNTEFDLGGLSISTRIEASTSVLLEDITFTGLGTFSVSGDMEINNVTFKETAGPCVFRCSDDGQTILLNGDIVLEHEDNELFIDDTGWSSQIKGNGVFKGEGAVNIDHAGGDDTGISDLTFEVRLCINDNIHLSNVILGEVEVNNDFTISSVVTLTGDMEITDDVRVYSSRGLMPLSDTVRGTLVAEEGVSIHGGHELELGDKIKLKDIKLEDLWGLAVRKDATAVLENVLFGEDIENIEIRDDATLIFASDIVVSENMDIRFRGNENSLIDGAGFSLLPANEGEIIITESAPLGGSIENLTIELEVESQCEDIIFQEVMFKEDVIIGKNARIIGGGWVEGASMTVDDCVLTFEAGIDKVYNAGELILSNGGTYEFETDAETDLEFPDNI